jgi:PX domain
MFGSKLPGTVAVSDPVKVSEPMNLLPYIKYKIKMSNYPTTMVKRRYSDFVWLADMLKAENYDCFVPELPRKSIAGRFKSSFIEERRKGLERFLNSIASHIVLSQSKYVELFLTANEDKFVSVKSTTTASSIAGGSSAGGGWYSLGSGRNSANVTHYTLYRLIII